VTDTETATLTANQAARRRRVLEAAMELADEGGYDAVQMRDVAARANVALGTIYRYFTSKDHLLAAAQVDWSRQTLERLEQRPPKGDTAAERVSDSVRRASRALERQPRLAAALVTAISSNDPAVSECQREVNELIGDILGMGIGDSDPEHRDAIVRVLSHVWFSSLLGWVNGWANVNEVSEEVEHAAELLLG
jgi:AcrR family transcriptional regulator